MFLFFEPYSMWQSMFTLDAEKVALIEKIIRPILVYAALIFLLRLFGKRELGQLNPIDLVVILSLSNTVQNAIIGEDNSVIGGIIGAVALLGINYFTAFIKFKSRKMETIIEGTPQTLIETGKINEKVINREMITREDLDVVAHKEGFESADDIEKCVLDPNGSFLVEGKEENKEDKFKKAVLQKLEDMALQIAELKKANR
jgi:uncharacterized membrane protein YcaP (DUF421 family)